MAFGTTAGDSIWFNTGTTVYARLVGAQNLSFSGGERETIDASELFSTASASLPGFPTAKTATFIFWFDDADATQTNLFAAEVSQQDRGFQYRMNGTTKRLAFRGKFTALQYGLEKNSMRQVTATVALSTAISIENDV
jgi:hypothetical protein